MIKFILAFTTALAAAVFFALGQVDAGTAKLSAKLDAIHSQHELNILARTRKNRPPKVKFITTIVDSTVGLTPQLCSWASDLDGDKLTKTWGARLGSVKKIGYKDPARRPNHWCTDYTGLNPGWETVTFRVTDHISKPVVRRLSFCVYPDEGLGPPAQKPAGCP